MESQIKSSFIPQDAGRQMRPRPRMGDGSDLLVLGAVILLIASLTLAGGVFLYSKYLANSISVKQNSIDRARAAIEPALIEELSRLDARMRSSDTLLNQHISIAAVFALLEQITLKSIELRELSISTDSVDTLKMVLRGAAKSVNSIALQSDLYGKSGVITSPIFSDINRGGDGLTKFRVDALLNPSAIRYRNVMTGGTGGAATIEESQPVDINPAPAATTTEQGNNPQADDEQQQ